MRYSIPRSEQWDEDVKETISEQKLGYSEKDVNIENSEPSRDEIKEVERRQSPTLSSSKFTIMT